MMPGEIDWMMELRGAVIWLNVIALLGVLFAVKDNEN